MIVVAIWAAVVLSAPVGFNTGQMTREPFNPFLIQASPDRPGRAGPTIGPLTVSQLARSRAVARQGVQRHADALAEEGLVAWSENPRHQRSKLLVLTTRGERTYRRARDAQLAWAAWIDDSAASDRSLQAATQVLRWCRGILRATGD